MYYYVYNNGTLYIKCMEHGQNGRRGETVLLHVGLDFRHVLVNVIILAQNMAGMAAKYQVQQMQTLKHAIGHLVWVRHIGIFELSWDFITLN